MSTERVRHALNGPTMGTRWSALFFTQTGFDPELIRAALQAAVDEVDRQMSTWNPDSDLMRLNAASLGEWVEIPWHLMRVLQLALDVSAASGGAFDIGMGDAVLAWGFGRESADPDRIGTALRANRRPTHKILTLDPAGGRGRKEAPLALDLNGIAKGYGVDRLAETLRCHGVESGLVGIDGEMRAMGLQPGGQPWTIAVEAPDPDRRAPYSILALEDAAVATSGDYRHRVAIGERYLSHTMDPRRGAPLDTSPASVTVVARSCAEADAWATALMVLGARDGAEIARQRDLDALFLLRTTSDIEQRAVGALFDPISHKPFPSLNSSEGSSR